LEFAIYGITSVITLSKLPRLPTDATTSDEERIGPSIPALIINANKDQLLPNSTALRNFSMAQSWMNGVSERIRRCCIIFTDITIAAVPHNNLFEDGFPYTYNWITAQRSGSQLLVAKSKSEAFKKDLKRVLDDDSTNTNSKRTKNDINSQA
jgi:hypothetical protein